MTLAPEDYDEPRKRPRFSCSDRMCGATDCANCHPMTYDNQEEPTNEQHTYTTTPATTARIPSDSRQLLDIRSNSPARYFVLS